MKFSEVFRFFIVAGALISLPWASADVAGKRPNILLILADDLGWSDMGCYGGEIKTPHLDALAEDGIRFSQAYNSSRCCPSRASLLTGLQPHQAGIGRFVGRDTGAPGYRGRLNENTATLAEVLKRAGYGTYMVGKWHVNEPGPTERGFDEFYGFVHGHGLDSWEPRMMIRLPAGRRGRDYAEGEYFATNAITDHALDFLKIARTEKVPWFLYVAYQAPHFPVQAPLELTESYVSTYEKGWDVLRAERLERLKTLGLVPASLPDPGRSPIENLMLARKAGSATKDGKNPAWDSLPPARRADLARRMAVYAAMVENMDANIGRLVADLRKTGELENTLILFLSDNGACAEWEPFGFDLNPANYANPKPGYGIDGNTTREPSRLHEGEALLKLGGPGSLFSYGSGWANLCNTPLWLYKHHAHEGGIRTPMIAHWPARILDKGAIVTQVAHVMDIMPTALEIAQADYPATAPALEGMSLLPAFQGKAPVPRALFFEHERNAAWRDGDWKLVGKGALAKDGIRPEVKWELYNLAADPNEQNNLAKAEPERVRDMAAKLLSEARRTHALPSP
jgi:arylsulfatase A-like enzyme